MARVIRTIPQCQRHSKAGPVCYHITALAGFLLRVWLSKWLGCMCCAVGHSIAMLHVIRVVITSEVKGQSVALLMQSSWNQALHLVMLKWSKIIKNKLKLYTVFIHIYMLTCTSCEACRRFCKSYYSLQNTSICSCSLFENVLLSGHIILVEQMSNLLWFYIYTLWRKQFINHWVMADSFFKVKHQSKTCRNRHILSRNHLKSETRYCL